MTLMNDPIDRTWSAHLDNIMMNGTQASPRGLSTMRIFNATLEWEARRSVILNPVRNLNYRFMMAEAYWILSGSDKVRDIAPYNPNIGSFSDDGIQFAGAYGPKVVEQMEYVVDALNKDSYTRQAVMTIWRESPPPSKDIPCTVSMVFYRNHDELDVTVSMRSSDAWLGVPYDVFNFSMILLMVAGRVKMDPGCVVLNIVNAHLYEPQWENVKEVIAWEVSHASDPVISQAPTAKSWNWESPHELMNILLLCRETKNKAACLERWRQQ